MTPKPEKRKIEEGTRLPRFGLEAAKENTSAVNKRKEASTEPAKKLTEKPIKIDLTGEHLTPDDKTLDEANKAEAVHSSYIKKIDTINKNDKIPNKEKDHATLKNDSIENIRYTRVFTKEGTKPVEKVTNLKEETARRIRAYTSNFDGKWYTIDYASMGNDSSGKSHEMGVGLGDILLDPDITDILVNRNGKMIRATKGIVASGRHKGRVGFIANGKYIGTRSGHKFRILSKSEVDINNAEQVAAYNKKSSEHWSAKAEHRKTYRKNIERSTDPVYNKNNIDSFMKNREGREKEVNTADISRIPETENVINVPTKQKGHTRITLFDNTSGTGKSAREVLEKKSSEWQTDHVIGTNEYMGNSKDPKLAGKLRNKDGQLRQQLDAKFNFEGNEQGLAYTLGASRFVVIKDGGEKGRAFFQKQCKESKGSVVLIFNGKDPKEFQNIARKEVENKKRPFYIIPGGSDKHEVIGNSLSPGSISKGGTFEKFKFAPSAAIIDMDEKGKITGVYFRSAENNFEQPISNLGHALTYGKRETLTERSTGITYKEGGKIEGTDITVDTIKAAETEARKSTGNIKEVLKRKNFMKLVHFAAKEIDVPAYAILAVMFSEARFQFDEHKYGDNGAALGIGQFHRAAWKTAKTHPKFSPIMSQVIKEDPSGIERSRSLLADIIGIAVYLRNGANSYIKDTAPNEKIDSTQISAKALQEIRWYYHVPAYRRAIKNGRAKDPEFYAKALRFHQAKQAKGGYKYFSDNAMKFKAAMANQ